VPYCPFDHTGINGPNCCLGSYTLDVGGSGGSGPSTAAWGGALSSCIDGPAVRIKPSNPTNALGLPVASILYVGGTGLNAVDDVSAQTVFTDTTKTRTSSNFFYANYFDIDSSKNYGDYDSSVNPTGISTGDYPPAIAPASNNYLNGTNTITIPNSGGLTSTGTAPGASWLSTDFNANLAANPFWEYTCLDRFHEVRARIRVMVRAWDSTSLIGSATSYQPNYAYEGGVGATQPMHDFLMWGDLFFNYTDTSGGAVRKSWANSSAVGTCTAPTSEVQNSLSYSYPSGTYPGWKGYGHYLDGFPLNFN
jgi:hypothetical protein